MKNVFSSFFNYALQFLKRGYRRLIRIEGDPHNIAMGFAMGLLVGMTPTIGFQMPIAVFLAIPLRLNKISSAAGVWITNPVSAPVIYPMNFLVGVKLFNIDISTEQILDFSLKSIKCLLTETPDIFLAATLGGIVLGVPIAIGGYYFALSAVTRYQAHRIKATNLS
jgi:hypothetical protein